MTDRQPVIRCRKLGHCYGQGACRTRALADIDLDVLPGEVVVLCGPGGSGKSTLLSAVGGLLPVREGSLQVLGQELVNAGGRVLTRLRRQIGFVADVLELVPSLTLAENVALALRFERLSAPERQQRVAEALDAAELSLARHLRPDCAGPRQRLRAAVARALVHRPRLILAVEPTSGVDEYVARTILGLFQRASRERGACVMITGHDSRTIEIADRLIVMTDGRIRRDERPPDIAR
jgi:putative ABC transport system ATP-binding protein